eukprot:TRINITY_DN66415_c3_g6_i2.p1 TRINITY_DN66415_c3_g6~~TRINITY_DN66415_c3_g6_i2.p1  ORF type:complete len:662 (-),score=323.35 TRINITY_DN66415_c3_g6_i2:29-2014(-)
MHKAHLNQSVVLNSSAEVERLDAAEADIEWWRRCVSMFALDMTIYLNRVVQRVLLDAVESVEENIRYWQSKQRDPMGHFRNRGPAYWMRHRPRVSIADVLLRGRHTAKQWLNCMAFRQQLEIGEAIDVLHRWQSALVVEVGEMDRAMRQLQGISDFDQRVEPFAEVGVRIARLLVAAEQKSPEADVAAADASLPIADDVMASVEQRDGAQMCAAYLQLLDDIAARSVRFPRVVDTLMQRGRRPSHWRRNWLKYVFGAAAGYVVVHQLFVKRDSLAPKIVDAARSFRGFLDEHLWQPVVKIYKYMFETFSDRAVPSSRQDMEQSQESLSRMLLEFGRENAQVGADSEGMSVEEYLDSLPERAERGDMSIVMHRYERDITHPVRSIAFGQLSRALLIQVQKGKVDSEAVLVSMDQILAQNEINFQVMATIPAIMAVYGFWALGQRAFSGPTRRVRSQRYMWRQIHNELRTLELVLLERSSSVPLLLTLHDPVHPQAIVEQQQQQMRQMQRQQEPSARRASPPPMPFTPATSATTSAAAAAAAATTTRGRSSSASADDDYKHQPDNTAANDGTGAALHTSNSVAFPTVFRGSSIDTPEEDAEFHGRVLLSVYRMQQLTHLLHRDSTTELLADLKLMASPGLSVRQRLHVLARMYRQHDQHSKSK